MSIDETLSGQLSAIILAGGRGTRAGGADKGLIKYKDKPLIEHVLDKSWDWDRNNGQIEEASDQRIEFLQGSSSGAAGGWAANQHVRRVAA